MPEIEVELDRVSKRFDKGHERAARVDEPEASAALEEVSIAV